MPERPTPEEFNKPTETKTETQTLNPSEAMKSAQDFFRSQGFNIDEAGLVSPDLTEDQLQQLAAWHHSTEDEGIDMPDEDIFYKKVLLGVSLWRQEEAGKINYLMGKGVGAEISLRGTIGGKTKRAINFPYRSHSDFELYAAYNPEDGKKKVYTPQFLKVFGSQEYFPSTDTKGLKNLPPHLLYETAETVDLGGIKVKVPQLELQFLDKWNSTESTPRAEGNDAELLAQQYVLDRELVRKYLVELVIKPKSERAKEKIDETITNHFSAITRLLRGAKNLLIENGEEPTTEAMAQNLNEQMESYIGLSNVSVGGVNADFWIPIEAGQIDLDGRVIDEDLRQEVVAKIEAKSEADVKRILDRERQMDELFNKIEQRFKSNS